MRFGDLIAVAPSVKYTVFIFENGKLRQWFPKRHSHGFDALDQVGIYFKQNAPRLLQMQVYSVEPTAFGYMNVKLKEGKRKNG